MLFILYLAVQFFTVQFVLDRATIDFTTFLYQYSTIIYPIFLIIVPFYILAVPFLYLNRSVIHKYCSYYRIRSVLYHI